MTTPATEYFESRFKVELDDIELVDEPNLWQDLTSEIVRDFDIHGILLSTKVTLTFQGDGYEYCDCQFNSNSFCNEINIKIYEKCSQEGNFELVTEGIIKNGDMKFLINKCTCETPIEDNSYFARIKGNKDIKGYPNVAKSKNGDTIAAASAVNVKLFDPIVGNYPVFGTVTYRKAYRAYELFKFIIAFITDDEVGFESDLLNTGDFKDLLITNGKHVSTAIPSEATDLNIGSFSFQEIMNEIFKIGNVSFRIIPGVKPIFKLEYTKDLFGSVVTDTLANANGVTKKVKTDQLYAIIAFGSSELISDVGFLSFPELISFVGFNDEQFHVTGKCNNDTTLDLKGNWVRSSNVIQYTFMNPDSSRDDKFFFIEADDLGAGNYQGKQFDILSSGSLPYYYNGDLTNYQISLRFFGAIPNSIAAFLGAGDEKFYATNAGASVGISTNHSLPPTALHMRFKDDFTLPNFDTNNVYGNGTPQGTAVNTINSLFIAPSVGVYRFLGGVRVDIVSAICPDYILPYNTKVGTFTVGETINFSSGASGTFIFDDGANLWIKKTGVSIAFAITLATGASSGATCNISGQSFTSSQNPNSEGNINISLEHMTSAGSTIAIYAGTTSTWVSAGNSIAFGVGKEIIMNGGEKIKVTLTRNVSDYMIISYDIYPQYFECNFSSNGGGIYQEYNPENIKAIEFDFEYPMSYSRFKNLKANPTDILAFNIDGANNFKPWIYDLKYSHMGKKATIKLLGTQVIQKKNVPCRG